eukprot:gb/GEZN01003796.1/.p1 GENE.gb/GEZN01003796.1/~~gb/GEZN01003796.1/.p1  ORF type:complete len:650 (-),score=75.04 gb/GEZN01003796.1/:106-2055(-)
MDTRKNLLILGGLASVGVGAGLYRMLGPSKTEERKESEFKGKSCAFSQGVQGVSIEWEDISVTLFQKRNKKDPRWILNRVSGRAPEGKITAFLGPSGSGKTTLLSLLAGQLHKINKISASGLIRVDGVNRPSGFVSDHIAFVHQDRVFFSHLTVQETLVMAIQLRLGLDPATADQRERLLEDLLDILNLNLVRNTIVGDPKTRGISGGEKKRLALGCEVIGWPRVIFCDEPTSGLDAYQALQVIQTLRKLADRGATVIVTLHQPRVSIYQEIDHLLLLSPGGVPVFSGPTAELAPYLTKLNYPVPQHSNPADFALDLISMQEGDIGKPSLPAYRFQFQRNSAEQQMSQPEAADRAAMPRPKVSQLQQFQILLQRSMKQLSRDTQTLFMRAFATTGAAGLFAAIYWKLGNSQPSIFSRQGLLQVLVNYIAMTSLVKTINVFGKERTLVQREISQAQYSVEPYLLSKIFSDLPIASAFPLVLGMIVYPCAGLQPLRLPFLRFSSLLTLQSLASASLGLAFGSMFPLEPALEAGKATMMISIIFGGFYFSNQTLPSALRWLSEISLVKKGFEGLLVNEFEGLCFEGLPFTTGEQVLQHINVPSSALPAAFSRGCLILVVNYSLTYLSLKYNQPCPVLLDPPGVTDASDYELP